MISTCVGISEIFENSVKVIPLTGGYMPKTNDLVIGKVIGTSPLSWEFDINSCFVGFLPAQDVFGRDYLLQKMNLNRDWISEIWLQPELQILIDQEIHY